MKYWIILLLGLLTLSGFSQKSKMTKTEFTAYYLNSLKTSSPDVRYNILKDLIIKSDYQGNSFTHYLENAYKEYIQVPDSINEIIKKYISSSLELYKPKEDVNVNHIIPMVKPLDHLAQAQWPVHEKYNEQLIIVYGEDTEKSINYITEEDLDKLNISRDTLLGFAKRNLKAILPDIQRMGNDGSYGIACGGDFEACLILLEDLWTYENFPVDGDFVIAIPNRDILFITGTNNKPEIERIDKIAQESYNNGNHPISPILFRWNGKTFEKYK